MIRAELLTKRYGGERSAPPGVDVARVSLLAGIAVAAAAVLFGRRDVR